MAERASTNSGAQRRHRQILVVEDTPAFAQQLVSAVESLSLPCPVRLCYRGSEALACLAEPDFDLYLGLIDLGLPNISGIEVIRAIRRRFATAPVMVVSVIADEQTVLEAIRAGACGYLLKTAPLPAIAQGVQDVLAGNYPISPALARYLFKRASDGRFGDPDSIPALSPRELETLKLIGFGHTYREVSDKMKIALPTVQANVRSLYRKLGVNSSADAVQRARDTGLL